MVLLCILAIWSYFTKQKKPDSPTRHNRHIKRDKRTKHAKKKLFDQPIFALFDITDSNRSTSRPPKQESQKHVEQPSVLKHFTRRKIADRYPDEWIE